MSFTLRTYDAIVRDMLTTLTGGTAHEIIEKVPPDTRTMPRLSKAPVRRISNVEGEITIIVPDRADPGKKKSTQLPYRFTAADFELISSKGDPAQLDTIRFREKGKKPTPGTTLIVNYYPAQTDPVPLTDISVGSVVRTILETIGIELALAYQQLDQVYKSAFIDTAEGDSLDRVVALVGVERMRGGHPVAKLRFTRAPGAGGNVTIPPGTPVTDAKGNRYLTVVEVTMETGETTREVLAAGESATTTEAEANTLTLLEVAIGGISTVTNPEPARKLTNDESDADVRLRVRGALRGTMRGTPDAIRNGVLAIEGVKDVTVSENPGKVAGEIRIDVAYQTGLDAAKLATVKEAVEIRINEMRPAGIRYSIGEAATQKVAVNVATLMLAGAPISGAELQAIRDSVAEKITAVLKSVPPGGVARRAQLSAAALSDSRVIDATIMLTPAGQAATQELTLPEATVLQLDGKITFGTVAFEKSGTAQPVTSPVSMTLPLHLVKTTSEAEARLAIESAVTEHLATRAPSSPLSVDSLASAIRDDTRFMLVREEVLVTVEAQGKFRDLSAAAGSYEPVANESLIKGTISIDVREGSV